MEHDSPKRGKLYLWLDERIGLSDFAKLAKKKQVPLHRHTFWYYFGGMTLFLFTIQVGTGILLLLYYRPSAGEAFESIQFIMTEVQFGWLVRSIHSWSANLMIFAMFIHLFSALAAQCLPAPARNDLALRRWTTRSESSFWLYRIPLALERAGVFCHPGGH